MISYGTQFVSLTQKKETDRPGWRVEESDENLSNRCQLLLEKKDKLLLWVKNMNQQGTDKRICHDNKLWDCSLQQGRLFWLFTFVFVIVLWLFLLEGFQATLVRGSCGGPKWTNSREVTQTEVPGAVLRGSEERGPPHPPKNLPFFLVFTHFLVSC